MQYIQVHINKEKLIEDLYTEADLLTTSQGFKAPDKEKFFEYYKEKFQDVDQMVRGEVVDSLLSHFVDQSVVDMKNGVLPFRFDTPLENIDLKQEENV